MDELMISREGTVTSAAFTAQASQLCNPSSVSEPYAAIVLEDCPISFWRLADSFGNVAYDQLFGRGIQC